MKKMLLILVLILFIVSCGDEIIEYKKQDYSFYELDVAKFPDTLEFNKVFNISFKLKFKTPNYELVGIQTNYRNDSIIIYPVCKEYHSNRAITPQVTKNYSIDLKFNEKGNYKLFYYSNYGKDSLNDFDLFFAKEILIEEIVGENKGFY